MTKVLIVDDEPSILTLLAFNLEKAGYEVVTATDGMAGYELAKAHLFDFMILDLMLPKMDGIEICKKLRQEKIETPILILTAKDDELDKIIGLELGADDYMTKPFSPREVLARIKAIMRRVQPTKQKQQVTNENQDVTEVELGNLTLYPEKFEVYRDEQLLELTPKEFELLLYFTKRTGRVLSREQLLEAIWKFDYSGETRIVDVHVSHLREKIEEDTKNPQYIRTVRGFGYKFEVPKS